MKYYAVRAGRIVEVYAYPEAARAAASWKRDVLAGGVDLAWARAEVTA